MSGDIKIDELITKENIDKAVDVLESALEAFNSDKKEKTHKMVRSWRERRSGKERRQDLLAPYFRAFVKKMLENFCSAKMLIFFLPLWASIFFLWILFGMRDEYLTFASSHPNAVNDINEFFRIAMNGFISWCTFTVSLGGTIIVVRETFKVQKLKALSEEDEDTVDEITQIQD